MKLTPIEQIAPETCQGLRGIVFDVDDTITRDGRLEVEALAALYDLKKAGLNLACVTGRPLGWADLFARILPVDVAVGENGAGWVWRDGSIVREGYFDVEPMRERQRTVLDRVAARVAREMPNVRLANDQRARRCDLAFDIGEADSLSRDEVDRLTALIREEGARSAVSSVHAHAIPGDWDKAEGAIRALAEGLSLDLGAERERWLFIGDSGNDVAAFAYFPASVGVANVAEHLPRMEYAPAFVTDADRGLGFAEMSRVVLEKRGEQVQGLT